MADDVNKTTTTEESSGQQTRSSEGGPRREYSRSSRPYDSQRPRRSFSRRGFYRKKVCKLCKGQNCPGAIKSVDYKNIDLLQRFVTERGKIVPRRLSGICAKGQRTITAAIKRARYMALLPYTAHDN